MFVCVCVYTYVLACVCVVCVCVISMYVCVMLTHTVHDKDYVRISAYARRMLLQLYAEVITGVRGSHYRCRSAEVITGVRGYQRVRVLLYVRVVLYMCTYVTLETTSRSST